jgi:diguanylate cyclase (GGDEF)-like protein
MVRINESTRLFPTVASIGFALTDAVLKLTRCPNVVAVNDPTTHVSTVVAASKGCDRRLLGMAVDHESVARYACLGYMTPDPGVRPLLGPRSDRRQREQQGTALPLRGETGSAGALVVFAPEGLIDGSMYARLEALANEAGHAIGEMMDEQLSQRLGLVDSVTGQPNRTGLDKAMQDSIGAPCSLVSFAVDQVPELEVEQGNRVVKLLATILRSRLRDYDVPARVGGAEFAVFLPDAPFDGAVSVADRVRTAVNETEFELGDSSPITCAFGVASMPDTVDSIDRLVTAAVDARVEGRASGPNRIATLH